MGHEKLEGPARKSDEFVRALQELLSGCLFCRHECTLIRKGLERKIDPDFDNKTCSGRQGQKNPCLLVFVCLIIEIAQKTDPQRRHTPRPAGASDFQGETAHLAIHFEMEKIRSWRILMDS